MAELQVQKIQAQMEEYNNEIQVLTRELQGLVDGRQKLIEQQNENELVLNEFVLLEPKAKVYKLIGSVLISQNLKESKDNVEKRLSFIKREIAKVDNLSKENQAKQLSKRQAMQKMQEQLYKIVQAFQAQQQQQVQK